MNELRSRRVVCVLAAGRRLQDTSDCLGREARARLPATSGLSPAGVELALGQHLESEAPPEEIAAFVRKAGSSARCHVIVAANVCTGALRAIAFAAATAPDVLVRASRRDPVVVELLARALAEDAAFASAGGALSVVPEIAARPGEELHVYGSDETIARLVGAHPEVVIRGHGTGMGVAVVGEDADEARAAAALARDVVPFDQRGCLSPRVALVEGPAERAERFAERLHLELEALQQLVPRGALDEATRTDLASYRQTATAVGRAWEGTGHLLGFDEAPRVLPLPPAARAIHVVPARAREVQALLGRFRPWIAAVGTAGSGALGDEVHALALRARRSELGSMQRPVFDGPVDLR